MVATTSLVSAYHREGEYLQDMAGGPQTRNGRDIVKREYKDFILINRARLLRNQLRNAGSHAQEIVDRSILSGFHYRRKIVPKVVISG